MLKVPRIKIEMLGRSSVTGSLQDLITSLVKMGIPLHSGAVKFWKEKGAQLPPELIK
jgi:hypothetical protein